ncbi:hypothetical protein OsI_14742 [Oryza sativa Indica Group]|uniref:DUF4220 domain-containing protein n=1 Tax=Oryza sativa subsp. indica TaxID=39946 RepID=B8AUY0_ORYSI|nr:hypothetical protein OsI_14742 [Oryza sativa Indica Group]
MAYWAPDLPEDGGRRRHIPRRHATDGGAEAVSSGEMGGWPRAAAEAEAEAEGGGWLNQTSLFVNDWAIRIVVLCSFAAHLVLTLFAGIRRRKATGVRALVLWLAYQLGGWAGTYALGSMSLGRTTQQQQQQLAFWAPFLLLHLAGPDNITAYSLEDTVLAGRQVLTVTVQILGASYVLYKQIYNRDGGGSALLWVSVVMFAIGIAKYVERAVAIRQANLGKMRSSNKKCKLGKRSFGDVKEVGNERTLLVAHGLLHITKGAFIDHSDDENPLKRFNDSKTLANISKS